MLNIWVKLYNIVVSWFCQKNSSWEFNNRVKLHRYQQHFESWGENLKLTSEDKTLLFPTWT
jgi:hypothetical protein